MHKQFRTPYFLVKEERLLHNLDILKGVSQATGCKILLAQKAFSMFACYPLLAQYLDGTTASGLHEAQLGATHFGGETHVFSPAFRPDEWDEILQYAGHIVFNSPSQVRRFAPSAKTLGKTVGLRVNPECSTQDGHEIYDPCAPGSRLGTTLEQFDESVLPLLDGLHFHTLCEQNADALEQTVAAFEKRFGKYLHHMRWLNLGGGHHITRDGYDLDLLQKIVIDLQNKYGVQVYLEPGEAVVLNAGFLVTEVLDVVHNGMDIAILDTSATCHMPDVIEMPYRAPLAGAGEAGEKPFTYRLAGPSCLAGDIIGDYSFDQPLQEGSVLIFQDMALYTMVKTNTFNGVNLPSIVYEPIGKPPELIRAFGYEDFVSRLS